MNANEYCDLLFAWTILISSGLTLATIGALVVSTVISWFGY